MNFKLLAFLREKGFLSFVVACVLTVSLFPLGCFASSDSDLIPIITLTGGNEDVEHPFELYKPYTLLLAKRKSSVIIPMVVYVSPDGTGDGTKANPKNIYSAVQEAVPGQKIMLLGGVYSMADELLIDRNVNGTAAHPICFMAFPENTEPPVLDFGGESSGLILAGDYWHLIGFSVTGSKNEKKAIHVCGHHNVLERITAFRNGGTGIQVSRYLSTDERKDWPTNNLILNCTSYLNADSDNNDADGFAAKITCGEGNTFDGCIAYYNADDGFDLYARVETGSIGQVVIRNCIAYKNGYLLNDNGKEITAGDGNGFKLGGDGLPGHHILQNSIAFANKARGIDGNSCPNVQIEHCTSFNNGYCNVQLYPKNVLQTDFSVRGILSFKVTPGKDDIFHFAGGQDITKVYNSSNFYVTDGISVNYDCMEAEESWFISLDIEAAIHGGITRNANGSINMGGFLELTEAAPPDTGAVF